MNVWAIFFFDKKSEKSHTWESPFTDILILLYLLKNGKHHLKYFHFSSMSPNFINFCSKMNLKSALKSFTSLSGHLRTALNKLNIVSWTKNDFLKDIYLLLQYMWIFWYVLIFSIKMFRERKNEKNIVTCKIWQMYYSVLIILKVHVSS